MSMRGQHSPEAREKMRRAAIANGRRPPSRLGTTNTPEHRGKIAAGNRGRVMSAETRAKISATRIQRGIRHTPETLAQIAAKTRGRKLSPESIAKRTAKQRGIKRSAETRRRMSLSAMRVSARGPASHFWKGGRTKDTRAGLGPWRTAVYARDNNTCQFCGETELIGRNRHADHVVAWASAPDMRFEVWNGRTLCYPCHRLHTTYQQIVRLREEKGAA